jgi:hypothetical protein
MYPGNHKANGQDLHRQGEEPTVKGADMVRMITTPTRLSTTQ